MLMKKATIVPPDGRMVFPVLRDMENITIIITDSVAHELRRIPIERPENLRSGAIVRTQWDGRFIGWKGTGKGKWFRADPSRANYFYTVVGEPKVEILPGIDETTAPPIDQLPMPDEVTEEGAPSFGLPTWAIIAIAGAVLFLMMKR